MKKIILATFTIGLSLVLVACNNGESDNKVSEEKNENTDKSNTSNKEKSDKSQDSEEQHEQQSKQDNKGSKAEEQKQSVQESDETNREDESVLNNYSAEEIEYARVWNQLGPMKNDMKGMDSLNVQQIPKGSKVNPQAEDSAVYQEDVVKLDAPMRAGGSVTYSSNGDGTINVYNKVPYDWRNSTDHADMKAATTQVIEEDIETVTVDTGNDKTIADLAGKVKYNE